MGDRNDIEVMQEGAGIIASAKVSSLEEWSELEARVEALAGEAEHPRAVLVNLGEALAWKKPHDPEEEREHTDAELIEAAKKLVRDAYDEAPLDEERYAALQSEIELIAIEADDEKAIRDAVAADLEHLAP